MTLGTTARIALVVGLLAVLGALAATFAPSSANGSECGTWVSPDWTEERTLALLNDAEAVGTSEALAIAGRAVDAAVACDAALDGRRALALGLLGVAVVGPGVVVFVGRGRERVSV